MIGPDVSIGIECEIGNGVRITNSVLLHRVKVRLKRSGLQSFGSAVRLSGSLRTAAELRGSGRELLTRLSKLLS